MMNIAGLIRRQLVCEMESRFLVGSVNRLDDAMRKGQFQCRLLSYKQKKPSKSVNKNKGTHRRQHQKQNSAHKPKKSQKTLRKKNQLPQLSEERRIPPAFLAPTGSPFVYVSRPALQNDDNDDIDECEDVLQSENDEARALNETEIDGHGEDGVEYEDDSDEDEDEAYDGASSLFAAAAGGTIPSLFASSTFHYVPPKELDWSLPKHNVPEVAFLGRSNVGKSSLVNAVMRQKLCLTSKSPGRTQQAYYYGLFPKGASAFTSEKNSKMNIASVAGFIVDLPGYGYAKAPDGVVGDWQSTTQDIILDRRDSGVLQRLYLLVDSRRDGPQPADRTVMSWLDQAEIPYTMVLTKADRVAVPLVIKQVNDFCARYASQLALEDTVEQSPVVHVTSSTEGMGIRELMYSIETDFVSYNRDET